MFRLILLFSCCFIYLIIIIMLILGLPLYIDFYRLLSFKFIGIMLIIIWFIFFGKYD